MQERREIPWFAGEDGDFLVFRVNRRPLDPPSLFTATMPEDVFEHFVRVLMPGYEVVTGRRYQRTWRVGGLERDPASPTLTGTESRTLTGKLGMGGPRRGVRAGVV